MFFAPRDEEAGLSWGSFVRKGELFDLFGSSKNLKDLADSFSELLCVSPFH